jgi:hypothetical protein
VLSCSPSLLPCEFDEAALSGSINRLVLSFASVDE